MHQSHNRPNLHDTCISKLHTCSYLKCNAPEGRGTRGTRTHQGDAPEGRQHEREPRGTMAGPNYDDAMRRWRGIVDYFERGTIGEAGLELGEAVERYRADEIGRWNAIVKEYPHAITGVDPGEFLKPSRELCDLFNFFLSASRAWLENEFVARKHEYWEEMSSLGCYWVRFKTQADFEKYKEFFSEQLQALDFNERSER
jgi:hypothetical protein